MKWSKLCSCHVTGALEDKNLTRFPHSHCASGIKGYRLIQLHINKKNRVSYVVDAHNVMVMLLKADVS